MVLKKKRRKACAAAAMPNKAAGPAQTQAVTFTTCECSVGSGDGSLSWFHKKETCPSGCPPFTESAPAPGVGSVPLTEGLRGRPTCLREACPALLPSPLVVPGTRTEVAVSLVPEEAIALPGDKSLQSLCFQRQSVALRAFRPYRAGCAP